MRTPLRCVAVLAALLAAACQASPVLLEVEDSVAAAAAPAEKESGPHYRLSGTVRPTAYGLLVSPHLADPHSLFGAKGFDGVVAIDMEAVERTNLVELHRGATIGEVHVQCAVVLSHPMILESSTDTNTNGTNAFGRLHHNRVATFCNVGRPLEARVAGWDKVTEKITVRLGSAVEEGTRLRLVLNYVAEFPSGALTGFYVSNFTSGRQNAAVLATNFRPTHARHAFPCFDEPALKATFDLALQLEDAFDAIASTPQIYRRDHVLGFARTPRISTYQLAFVVYESASFAAAGPAPTFPLRTWARREAAAADAARSLAEATKMLRRLEAYTQMPFEEASGLPRLHQVALPDFQAEGGAVENWGLLLAREDALLFQEASGTAAARLHMSFTITHQLAHQWFGNLVTTHWWSTAWLHEGFAKFLQYNVHGIWWIHEQELVDVQMSVFQPDAAEYAAPLTDPGVYTPQEIDDHFGAITHNKGGSILRQIRNVLGEQHFRNALHHFLKSREFSDATPEHLFDALLKHNNETRTGLNNNKLLAVFQSWTDTPGYPVLIVNRTGPNTFRLSQKRFLQSGAEDAEKYHVYVTWMTSREKINGAPGDPPLPPMAWLNPDVEEIVVTIPTLEADEWVLFNVDQSGYYRVHYDEATWEQLQEAYWTPEMSLWAYSSVDRAALHDNAVALARAGRLPWRRAMCMVAMVRHDNQPVPWAAARQALAPLARLLHCRPQCKEFVNFLVGKDFTNSGFDTSTDESDVRTAKHKVMIAEWACGAGSGSCLEEAKRVLHQHLNDASVKADAQSVALCYGLKGDDGSLWEPLWARYLAGDAGRRAILTHALGCTDHAPSLRRYLEYSLDPTMVRGQDASSVFMAVLANPDDVALQVALQFFVDNGYAALEQAYGQVKNAMTTIVEEMASRMTEDAQRQQLERALGNWALQHTRALRAVQANVEWLRAHEDNVLEAMTYCSAAAAPAAAAAAALLLALLLPLLGL